MTSRMKSAFAVHKENTRKTPVTIKVKLKTGKVSKAKKTQKKAAPKSKSTKEVVASNAKKNSASKSKQSAKKSPKTPDGKQSPVKKQTQKVTSPTSKKDHGKQKKANKKTSSKPAKDTKVEKKAQKKNEPQKKPRKGSSSSSTSMNDVNQNRQAKKSPSPSKMKSPKVTPSKDNTSKPLSAKGSQRKSSTKHASPPVPAGKGNQSPALSTPTSSMKKSVQKVKKGKTKNLTEKESKESVTSPKEAIPQKYPPSTPKGVSSLSDTSVDLTPVSKLIATKEASKDSVMVKITPLKSHGDSVNSNSTRKRKNAASNSKNSKKLKIKLTPQRKVPAKTNSSSPKNGGSPRIVNSSTTPNGLPGANGLNTVTDSGTESALLFEWLIAPVTPQNFFDNLWEKKPLLVRRHKPQYFQGLFTTDEFHNILKQNDIQFSKHLDITTYTGGKRETHNPEGRAHAPVVWDYFNNGCSVRLLNPQTYSAKVWKLLSTLQEHFGSFCGANVYLTPANTQGFAPHYDDIEAFILQLEGRKRWRLYSPRSDNEMLPRTSSENFTDAEIGAPILDMVLEEGDVLYFPRGFIHQATPPPDTHSLHLTVSTYQKNTWGDLMEKLCDSALRTAMEEDLTFRQSLPRDYLNFMGIMNSDEEDDRRTAFISKIGELFMKLASYAPVDLAADQLGMNLIHSSLPPVLTDEEMSCMIHATKVRFVNGEFVSDTKLLSEDTEIQLIRRGVLRLIVTQENEIQVHHCTENSRVYHEKPCQYFVIPPESAPGVEFLIRQYPKFVKVDQLPLHGDLKGKEVELANLLFEKGLIRTKHPLDPDVENER